MASNLRLELTEMAHRYVRKVTGCDILRYRSGHFYALRRAKLIRTAGITCVIDVGANAGQYGSELRETGYSGRLISFEPVSAAFEALSKQASKDQAWQCLRMAVGSHDGTASLNVADNLVSSSVLPMLQAHREAAPQSRYVRTEEVPMRSLDSLAMDVFQQQDTIWLKLDVQGYERSVLEGAKKFLSSVQAIEVELSLQPLYEGQTLYLQMIEFFRDRGFALASVAPGFQDENSGRLFQFDAVFLREAAAVTGEQNGTLKVAEMLV